MSNTKHTPGPWFTKESGTTVFAPNKRELSASFEVARAMYTNSKHLPLVNGNLDSALANAKLIAAAPEMLDALQDIIKFADEIKELELWNLSSAVEKAVAVNKKATE